MSVPMGPTKVDDGYTFRVWAPNARTVAVIGEFNGWFGDANHLESQGDGTWSGTLSGARTWQEYKYRIGTDEGPLDRIDPYARQVTNSVGNGILTDPGGFDWQGDSFRCPSAGELVIYELHIGTFTPEGTFDAAVTRLDHLVGLGVNAIEVMPIAEFAGDDSWGYNPAHPFAVESVYGGPDQFRHLVRECHKRGIAVILDVVYNHFGPSDLQLWRFDGWSQNGKGGIYFYEDDRSATPWGDTRPDYGRAEVRQYITDNALMWVQECHVDGLRLDMTAYIRSLDGFGAEEIPDGWSLMRELNDAVHGIRPDALTIAEDMRDDHRLTAWDDAGAAFSAQWDGSFVRVLRSTMQQADDASRSIGAICGLLTAGGDAPFARVLFTESHDAVANGHERMPPEISPTEPTGWLAQKKSTVAAGIALTAPGIPMIFEGQEFLTGGWFQDTVGLDWSLADTFAGTVAFYRDLIRLRRNWDNDTRGLSGEGYQVTHCDEGAKVLAMHRWFDGGPGDDVVVVANLGGDEVWGQRIGFPAAGPWRCKVNSDSPHYGPFAGKGSGDLEAVESPADGQPASAELGLGPYSVMVFARA